MEAENKWNLIEVVSVSVDRTVALGEAMATVLRAGDVVALRGELGAGKTQWVRGLAKGLGADPRKVSSPTFVVMQEYDGKTPVLHIDAYRIHSLNDLETTGWTPELAEQSVTAIEWAGRMDSELPENRLEISFEHIDDQQRRITIRPVGNFERRPELATAVESWREQSVKNGCKCPICSKPVLQANRWYPFCSQRCKQVDLGRWLNGSYRIGRSVDWDNDDLDQLASEPPESGESSA